MMNFTNCILKTTGFCLLLLPASLRAQQVTEGSIKVGKEHKNGFIAVSKYSRAELSDLLATKLTGAGLKQHNRKHKFHNYKGIVWNVTGPTKVDLSYRVTGKKHKAKIYLIASKGYDNYITGLSDANTATSIYSFLTELDGQIANSQMVAEKQAEINKIDTRILKQDAQLQKTQQTKVQKSNELQLIQKSQKE